MKLSSILTKLSNVHDGQENTSITRRLCSRCKIGLFGKLTGLTKERGEGGNSELSNEVMFPR